MRRLALAALLALGGCKSSSRSDAAISGITEATPEWLDGRPPREAGSPRDGGTIVVRMMIEPATLNYLDDTSFEATNSRMLARNVVETLVELAADGTLVPGLASAWQDSSDHTRTTFTLRDATFSSGDAFTASDVVATLDVVMSGKKPTSGIRGELGTLASWKAVDARTVELQWKSPSVFALRSLARVPMLSRAQLEGEWAAIGRGPIGTGPWVVKSWERGQRLTLARRPDTKSGYLETIIFRFVKDHTAASTMFEKGEFDLMTNITPALWRALEKDDTSNTWAKRDWNRLRSLDNSFSFIAWNQKRGAFGDVRVRRALAQLYDAQLINQVIDLGLEVPTVCPYYPGTDSCSKGIDTLKFDQAAARATLSDAGIDATHPLAFTFLLPANSVRLGRLVPMLQEQFRTAGVMLEVERVETATLSARIAKRDFDAMSRVWTEFDRDQDLFQLFHSSQIDGGSNYASLADPDVDRLIEQIRAEFEVEKRRALERQLHERLYSLQPFLLMTNRQSLDASKKRVHGLQPSLSWYDLRRVWVSD